MEAKRNYSLTEIVESLPKEKNKSDPIIVQFIIRPLSFLFTWLFLRTSLSPNQVSYLSAVVCIVSGLMLAFSSSSLVAVIGAIGLNLFSVLDAVDGNMARVQKRTNGMGDWADAVGGYVAYATALPAAGIEASKLYHPTDEMHFWVLVSGLFAAIFTLLTRVIHQKYINSSKRVKTGEYKEEKIGLIKKISREIGLTGFLLPLILLGYLFHFLDIVVIVYAVYYLLGLGAILFRYIWKVEKSSNRD